MKFILTILLLIPFSIFAQVPNTNALNGVLADTNGYWGWPIDQYGNSLTLTNYSGSTTSILVLSAGTNPLFYTNYTTGTSFTLHQNSHFTIQDQYQTTWNTGTNGVLSISQINGNTVSISNGIVTVNSNGLPGTSISQYQISAQAVQSFFGNYYQTNGAWNLFAITNRYPNVPYYFWVGPSNRSFINMEYSNGAIWYSNIIYQP